MMGNVRSLDVAKASPFNDLQARVRLPRNLANFIADMLAFAVAIRPYEEDTTGACLLFDVFCDRLLVLELVLAKASKKLRLGLTTTGAH